jgi:hypothetical protein
VVLVGVLAKMGGRTTGVGVQAGFRLPEATHGNIAEAACYYGSNRSTSLSSLVKFVKTTNRPALWLLFLNDLFFVLPASELCLID